ncbi:MAG TPA: DUF3054 domain-containing protein [Acidimicrobiales bacterium]
MLAALAAAVDVLVVLVFVVIGRRTHEEGTAIIDTFEVAAPYLIALAAGWVAGWVITARASKRRLWPLTVRFGVVVWLVTVALGTVLRHSVFDRGTAGSFVIVASSFLALFLLGWRVLAGLVLRRRATAHV